jgi:mannose-6-phosphate isomerase-like protein (cupin superfamily)
MINRNYQKGELLDVAGLNQITVLVDRSETELTETGWNSWPSDQDSPPHRHNDKDQIFYVTHGKGTVKVGSESYAVKPGNLVYVPCGTVHQTINTGIEPLCYMLFNIFNDESKEGHATFADHIEKVKQTRKKQAETGSADADQEPAPEALKSPRFFESPEAGKFYDFGSNDTILLLERNDTTRCELALVRWHAGNKGAMVAHKDKEQTFFILEGRGQVTIGEETEEVVPGNVIFVPRNTKHTTEAVGGDLNYLVMNSLVNPADDSFANMYDRIIDGRMERWKSGDTAVGE